MGPIIASRWVVACAAGLLGWAALFAWAAPAQAADPPAPREGSIRVATFNVSLARRSAGRLIDELRRPAAHPKAAAQIAALVEIIQRVRPDVLLVQELDWDPAGEALSLFEAALAEGRNGAAGIAYAHRFTAPVNAGLRTGFDLDRDGKTNGPADAQGWGVFPGQFGMALLSRFPIDRAGARTFQRFRWADLPGAAPPRGPDGGAFFAAEAWAALRLTSKNHWDVGVKTPGGGVLRVLASHPTPPVFDGPEDRNGLRNAAEIGFWTAYIGGAAWPRDDQGRAGGLAPAAAFVILGDLNLDPADGEGVRAAVQALLAHPRVRQVAPESAGGRAAPQTGANARHRGPAATDTADWKDVGARAPGNLRVDYALPSTGLTVTGSGVFWPPPGDPLRRLVGDGFPPVSSDHRLVWLDLAPPKP